MTSSIVPVVLIPNRSKQEIEDGRELPYLMQAERTSSSVYTIDSANRISGDPFNYYVDMNYQLSRCRYLRLVSVTIPKLYNVNLYNNTFRIKSAAGGGTLTATLTLPIGIYNQISLANALTSVINAGFVAAGIADTVVTTFNPLNKTFKVESVGVINFFFVTDLGGLIERGKNLAPFPSVDSASAPSAAVIYSGASALLYSRYLTVSSNSLTQYSVGEGLLSSNTQPGSVLAVIDLTNLYDESDYNTNVLFAGIYRSFDVLGANLSVLNGSRSLPSTVDIDIRDQYSLPVAAIMNLGAPYPDNSLSVVLNFEVTY